MRRNLSLAIGRTLFQGSVTGQAGFQDTMTDLVLENPLELVEVEDVPIERGQQRWDEDVARVVARESVQPAQPHVPVRHRSREKGAHIGLCLGSQRAQVQLLL